MSTDDHTSDGDGKGFVGRFWRRVTHSEPQPVSCDHPHACLDLDGGGEQAMTLACEECGRPLNAHDPIWKREGHQGDAKVCIECAGTHWTIGTRRSV